MTATNKQLLISDLNQCTPCRGKHMATLRETPIELDGSHCSREKGLPTQSIACQLTDPRVYTQFLS
jgi:hypothetical protein